MKTLYERERNARGLKLEGTDWMRGFLQDYRMGCRLPSGESGSGAPCERAAADDQGVPDDQQRQ